jgi:serine/threonine protein phosphatase PrpC
VQNIVFSSLIHFGGRDEDRLAVLRSDHRLVIAVADGAGGVSGGAHAAEVVCTRALSHAVESNDWAAALEKIDEWLVGSRLGGESTGVIIEIHQGLVQGASVGDSGALLISSEGIEDLTVRQYRKPLLGSGRATPVPFGPVELRGRLVAATDGLLKYVSWEKIAEIAMRGVADDAVRALVDAARLPNGVMQDDVAVVLCELVDEN